MGATSTSDLLFRVKPRWTTTIGSGGVADDTTTTIPLASASGLNNGEAYIVTINRVDANGDKQDTWETVKGVLSGTNLINCVRGVEGTAQAWSAGTVVEILMTAEHWNKMVEWAEEEHNQDGTHDDTKVAMLAGSQTFSGEKTFSSGLKTDTISEKTADNGVTIDGVLLKDNQVNTDQINEKTADNGVAIDGILLKDNLLTSGILGYSHTRFKVGSFTRDLSAAAGDQQVTGVGFEPKAVVFIGSVNATVPFSVGVSDATTNGAVALNGAFTNWTIDNYCIILVSSSGNYQQAVVKSFDSDGFTMTWSKINSPSGSAKIYYLAFR